MKANMMKKTTMLKDSVDAPGCFGNADSPAQTEDAETKQNQEVSPAKPSSENEMNFVDESISSLAKSKKHDLPET